MRVFVQAISVLGPGLPGWEASGPILAGDAPYVTAELALPPITVLPPAERRRTGISVKLALSVGLQALEAVATPRETIATVFTSSGGDGQVIHEICQSLATAERDVSPTRFHNSVHNASAGYWGIALRSHAPSTSLCGYDWSFAAGLLEAATQCLSDRKPVLLVSYDAPYPEPLNGARPIVGAIGVALLLGPEPGSNDIAELEIALDATPGNICRMASAELEILRANNPTGRSLPILSALAKRSSGEVILEYLDVGTITLKLSFAR
jgi:hypothetical protein